MSGRVRFVCLLHSHQPVGNFDHVIEEAYELCYRPYVEKFSEFPDIPLSNHFSGCLLEWLEEHHPDYLEILKKRANPASDAAKPWEMIGGGFYEPIVTMLHARDCAGQIAVMSDYLQNKLNAKPRGMWLAERVWEPGLVSRLADAGVEYLTLDDNHFKASGLFEEELVGGFVTESEGRALTVYPATERLRYLIPFHPVTEVIDYLKSLLPEEGERVVCYADDGEKFGVWPGTHQSVFKQGWLTDFLTALSEAQDEGWLVCSTLGDAHDAVSPAGRVYLPENSYREMTEWALPAERLATYERSREQVKDDTRVQELLPLVRGGNWRNFRVKYAECGQMYAKMNEVSAKIADLPAKSELGKQARKHLYRGQCNCPYWHGVFGGAYLPHLRSAIYRELIQADNLADEARAEREEYVERDLDFDGEEEVKLANGHLALYFHPSRGGHLYEIDLRGIAFNIGDTFSRRYEAYHDQVAKAVVEGEEGEQTESIHDMIRAKEVGLTELLEYDAYLRESLVDHFSEIALTPEDFFSGDPSSDDGFRQGTYEVQRGKSENGDPAEREGEERGLAEKSIVLSREGQLASTTVLLTKRIILGDESRYRVKYRVENTGAEALERHFAIEMNYSLLAGDAHDRYYYNGDTENAGKLATLADFGEQPYVGLKDHWLNIALTLTPSKPAQALVNPVKTVSNSEGGFESVYQSSSVVLQWPLKLGVGEVFEVELVQEVHSAH